VDYLETRPEVDKRRIGITGISGGGAVSWYTAAVDERIAAVAPVCSTYTFGSQAAHWLAAGQCDCIYFHNTYLQDFPIVGALIAPRPLIMFSGRKDPDFPPDGYHEVFRRVKKIYDLYAGAASDRIQEVDDDVGHMDAPLFLKGAREWMNRWLNHATSRYRTERARRESGTLACLSKLPQMPSITAFIIASSPLLRSRTTSTNRRSVAGRSTSLGDKVFRWFLRRRSISDSRHTNDGGWARYANYGGEEIASQFGRPSSSRPNIDEDDALLIYAGRPGDSIYFLDLDELLPVLGRYAVLILNRG
jgi:hypothetical protein